MVAPTVIEEPEEIDAEAEAEFIEASVPESTDDSEDDDSDDDFAVEESDEDDDALEPMHCYPHVVLLLPRVSFPLFPPALIRSSQSTRGTRTGTGVRKSVDPARTGGN